MKEKTEESPEEIRGKSENAEKDRERMRSLDEKFSEMTQTPVRLLICRLAVPTIISNLITTFYNMADAFFIGKISTSASGAVGIAFSVMAVIQAIGFFFGQGSGNNISRMLGQHREKESERLAATGFFSALIAGALFGAGGLLLLEPLCRLLGSTDTILPYAMDYIRLILIGAPYMAASLVLNCQLRFEGSALYGMVGLTAGGVLNLILDPVFIFVCDMGISGAALATILSQLASFCLLFLELERRGTVPVRPRNFTPSGKYYRIIFNGGLPSLCRQSVSGVATACMNVAAGSFGDAAVAAMAIVTKIANFTNAVLLGFGQGFQPVCGYNYGAGRYDRVREGFWFCVKTGTLILAVFAVAEWIAAPFLIELFRKGDPQVLAIGTTALRFQCLTLCLNGWLMISNMMMQTTGKVVSASFLGMARQGIFLIPIVFALSRLFGITGVQAAQPAADLISFLCCCILQTRLLREMDREESRRRQ